MLGSRQNLKPRMREMLSVGAADRAREPQVTITQPKPHECWAIFATCPDALTGISRLPSLRLDFYVDLISLP